MKVYEFGPEIAPAVLLLPGTCRRPEEWAALVKRIALGGEHPAEFTKEIRTAHRRDPEKENV